MDDKKRKYITVSLGVLYVLPTALETFMLLYGLMLIADKTPEHIIWTIFYFMFLLLGCVTYLLFYIAETKQNQRFVWISGIINAIVWECVCINSFYEMIVTYSYSDMPVWCGVSIYMGLVAYLNYWLLVNDTKRVEPCLPEERGGW